MTRLPNRCRVRMLLWLSLALLAAAPAGAANLDVMPKTVCIGAGYDGAVLKISGTVPAASDVVLRFSGSPADLHLRQKEKVFGLLWMNRSMVTFKNIPGVCLVQSSRLLGEMGPAAAAYGLETWSAGVKFENDHPDAAIDGPRELLRLKMQEGLFRETIGGITFSPPSADGAQAFSADFPVPAALSPGNYRLEAIAFKDGAMCTRLSVPVRAELTGLPAWLSSLAHAHGAIYGVLATAIALVAGLFIGMIFQGRSGAH